MKTNMMFMPHIMTFMLPCIWACWPDILVLSTWEMHMVTAAMMGKIMIRLKLKPGMVHISMPRKLVLKLAMELSCSVARPVSTPLARPAWIASIRPVWAAAPLAAMPSAVQAALMASLGMPRMYCTGR